MILRYPFNAGIPSRWPLGMAIVVALIFFSYPPSLEPGIPEDKQLFPVRRSAKQTKFKKLPVGKPNRRKCWAASFGYFSLLETKSNSPARARTGYIININSFNWGLGRRPRQLGSRKRQYTHRFGAAVEKSLRALGRGGAGGDHVVRQDQIFPDDEIPLAGIDGERARQIFPPL